MNAPRESVDARYARAVAADAAGEREKLLALANQWFVSTGLAEGWNIRSDNDKIEHYVRNVFADQRGPSNSTEDSHRAKGSRSGHGSRNRHNKPKWDRRGRCRDHKRRHCPVCVCARGRPKAHTRLLQTTLPREFVEFIDRSQREKGLYVADLFAAVIDHKPRTWDCIDVANEWASGDDTARLRRRIPEELYGRLEALGGKAGQKLVWFTGKSSDRLWLGVMTSLLCFIHLMCELAPGEKPDLRTIAASPDDAKRVRDQVAVTTSTVD